MFRQKGREGEREGEKHWLATRHVPWLVTEPATFGFAVRRSIHWATPARAFLIFKIFYLFIFIEREKEGEREKHLWERNMDWLPLAFPQLGTWPAMQACDLTRNWTGNLLVCRLVLNPLSHTSQGCFDFLILFFSCSAIAVFVFRLHI